MKTIVSTEFKADKVFDSQLLNGKKVRVYQKTIGHSTYSAYSLNQLKSICKDHKPFDNTGAVNDYGKGLYNGD